MYGLEPASKDGEYFRMSIATWPPLWKFVQKITPFEIPNWERGLFNDGQEYSPDVARRMADAIEQFLQSGDKFEYEEVFTVSMLAGLAAGLVHPGQLRFSKPPPGDDPYWLDALRRFAAFCRASGGFAVR